MEHTCFFCHIKTVQKLIKKFSPGNGVANAFVHATQELLINMRDKANPELATEIHRLAKAFIGNQDLYTEEKLAANELLLHNYDLWKEMVVSADEPLDFAMKLSVVGNIIDYGAHCVQEDLSKQLDGLLQQDLRIDMRKELKEELDKAGSVLFLGDNCGELVLDKLLIETMQHPNVTYAVRGMPVINDVTIEDAKQVGMDKVCRLLSNGFDAPSTLLHKCSPEFREAFEKADLIVSKGMGNFEGLMNHSGSNIFFLLVAKCKPMADMLGVNKNDMVIKRQG